MDTPKTHYGYFIQWILDRLGDAPKKKDSGAIARLRRSDSFHGSELFIQSWEILFRQNIEERHFIPCCTVAAAMCRADISQDGSATLGTALASCYDNLDNNQQSLRLRRILSCSTTEELCMVIRPVLSFISAKASQKLCYTRLLQELIDFDIPSKQDNIKLHWAKDFWSLHMVKEKDI